MKEEFRIFMDEKRNLFLRGENEQEYSFWALGHGIPVSLMVETEAEAALKDAQYKEARAKEAAEWKAREEAEKKRHWWNRPFSGRTT